MMVKHRRRRVVFATAAITTAVSVILGGCASGPASDDAEGERLTMWSRSALEAQAKGYVELWNETHDTQVDLTIIPDADYQTKVGAAAGSDSLPDVLSADVVYLPNYTSQGLFTDLSDKISDLDFAADLAPSHLEAGTWEDKEYTVPFVLDLSVLFYNRDLYTQAGLDPESPPKTLEEFAEQAKAVANAGIEGVSGTYFGGNCPGCLGFTWWPSIWASGGEVLSSDGTESLLNSTEAQKVYSIYRDLFEAGAVAPGAEEETGATWVALYPEGKIGIQAMPSSQLGAMPVDTGVAPIPGPDGGESTFVGGDSIGISAASDNQEAAWEFISWTLSEEAQVQVLAANDGIVVRSDLADNEFAAKDPRLVTINELAAKGKTPSAITYGAAFNDPNGPWLTLIRSQIFGDGSNLDADNDAITSVLTAK